MDLDELVAKFDPGRYEADRWLYYEITGERIRGYGGVHDTFYQGGSSNEEDWGGG